MTEAAPQTDGAPEPVDDLTIIRRASAYMKINKSASPLQEALVKVFDAEIEAVSNMEAVAWAFAKTITIGSGRDASGLFQIGHDEDGQQQMYASTTPAIAALARAVLPEDAK